MESGAFRDCDSVIREALSLKMRVESCHPQAQVQNDLAQLCYLKAMAVCDATWTQFAKECRHEVGGWGN